MAMLLVHCPCHHSIKRPFSRSKHFIVLGSAGKFTGQLTELLPTTSQSKGASRCAQLEDLSPSMCVSEAVLLAN